MTDGVAGGLILASASASRAAMLRAACVPFSIDPADLDEEAIKEKLRDRDGSRIALALAKAKALAISTKHPKDLVLGADSVLVLDGELVSKCRSLEEAGELLRRMSGTQHRLISAAVLALDGAPVWHHVGEAVLHMRPLTEEFIADYLAGEGIDILSCVGCYKMEGRGAQLFESCEGDYFSILGLPLLPLLAELRRQEVIAT